MAGTSSTTNDSNKIRRGLYECVCGKVKADVIIQPKGWTRAEPFTLYCGCRDCVNYTNTVVEESQKKFAGDNENDDIAKKLQEKGLVTEGMGATSFLILYDTDVYLTEGEENLRCVQVKEGSPLKRLYTSCCSTPMFNLHVMTGIYPNLLRPHPKNSQSDADDGSSFVDVPDFPAKVCAHSNEKPEGSAPLPPDVAMEKGVTSRLSCMFLSKLIYTPFQGTARGYETFKTVRQVGKEMETTIGIESISS